MQNGSRYVTWKEGILLVIGALVATSVINVSTSLYLIDTHRQRPHAGAADAADIKELKDDIRELRVEIRRMYIAAREE
jgi:hypothetical protein